MADLKSGTEESTIKKPPSIGRLLKAQQIEHLFLFEKKGSDVMPRKEEQRVQVRAAKLKPKPDLLPSGAWRCRAMVNGEKIVVLGKSPEEAHAKVIALKAGLVRDIGLEAEARRGNLSLADAIESYITARENVLSPTTINGYREIKRNRFPSLMEKTVSKISPSDLQEAVNEDACKVSAKTIKNALGLVVPVISEYKDISTKRIRLPQRKRIEHSYLDAQGMIELFEAIQGETVELPILLAVWLGMRRSEIMGLCWDCIDFEAGTIKVARTYVKSKDKGYVLRDEMKTEAARRTLECPGYILEKLKSYPGSREGRIFHFHPNTIYKVMKRICDQYGIDFVGVHGLRHTNASVMLSLGIMDKVAMARGGWSTDVTMKQIYQHVFASDRAAAGGKVNTFFETIAQGIVPGGASQPEP